MSKIQVDTIDTRSGTSTMQIGSTNTTTITLGVSGDTINVPSGVTIANAGTATGFGGDNTPSFMVYNASNQSLSTSTWTKATLGGEVWDTDNAFGSSKFTVPSGEGGKYHFTAGIHIQDHTSGRTQAAFYKNGSIVATDTGMAQLRTIHHEGDTTYAFMSWNGNLAAGDYMELYCEQTGGSTENIMLGTWFSGFKLIGV